MNELEKELQEEYKENKRKWMLENGFDEAGITYILTGDTYAIKEELKAKGYKYNQVLRWHKSTIDEEYAGRAFRVDFGEVAEMSAWGKGIYKPEAQKYIDNLLEEVTPPSRSEWVFGEVGDKIKDIKVQLVRKHSYNGNYGLTTLYSFKDEHGNIINWWSSTIQSFEINDYLKIKVATIKKLDEYRNVKNTVITRVKLIEI